MLKKLKNYQALGVVNWTPNSFSDSGLWLNHKFFHESFAYFLSDKKLIIDIGFESTAPFNQSISKNEEKERFLAFLREFKKYQINESRLFSIDTYRIDNFLFMSESLKEISPKLQFIFNDVSGVVDRELIDFIKKSKKSFYYVYTFSHIPDRGHVQDHMKYQKNEPILKACADAFIKVFRLFKQNNLADRLILDPGFGFSKSYEQNWELLEHFDKVIYQVGIEGFKGAYLLGLSKKSFIRKEVPSLNPAEDSELIHYYFLLELLKIKKNHLLFRVHDPSLVNTAISRCNNYTSENL